MRVSVPVVALALALMACGGADDAATDTMMGDTAGGGLDTMTTGGTGTTATFQAMAVDNSGVTADVTLNASGEQTTVTMHVTGAPANATLPAHVHSGTCENKGPAVAPLDSVSTDATGMGMLNATVNLPFTTVSNGQHFVQLHLPNGQPAACGNVPAQTM